MAVNRMRGGLPRAITDLQQAGRTPGATGGVPSNGVAEAAASVAGDLSQLSRHIGRMADKAAAREGEAEGRQAGLDPEFRTMATGTIRADAYDRAGLQVAETRLRGALSEGYDAAAAKHEADPQGLARALDGVASGVLAGAPSELAPGLKIAAQTKRMALMRGATRAYEARVRADQQAAMQDALALQLKSAHQQAYAMGLDAAADDVAAANIAQLDGLLARTGVDGKPLVAPAQAAKLKRDIVEEITTARLIGAFDRIEGVEAKAKFLDGLKDDFANSRGLAAVYDFAGYQRISGQLATMLRAAAGEARQRVAGVTQAIKGFEDYAAKGFAPSPDQLAGIKAQAAAIGDPEVQRRVGVLEAVHAIHAGVRSARPAEIEAAAEPLRDKIRRDGPDATSVALVTHLENLAGEARKELQDDPNGWADRTGLVRLAPLDFAAPDTLAASLQQRLAQAEYVGETYGQAPKYLRPDEARQLGAIMGEGGAAALQIAQTIASGAGDRAPAVLAELGKGAPAMAHLGALATQAGGTPPLVAIEAADGLALQRTEGHKPLAPKVEDLRGIAATASGGALARMPEALQAAVTVTNAAYEVRAGKRRLTDFDSTLWEKTFREVLGETERDGIAYGGIGHSNGGWLSSGTPVVVPPWLRQDSLDDAVADLRLYDAGAEAPRYATNGAPVSKADLARATLVQLPMAPDAGAWRYRLNIGSDDLPQWLVDVNGDPYVLDLDQKRRVLANRRPDLVLGGR